MVASTVEKMAEPKAGSSAA
jgi:hypothetical protein